MSKRTTTRTPTFLDRKAAARAAHESEVVKDEQDAEMRESERWAADLHAKTLAASEDAARVAAAAATKAEAEKSYWDRFKDYLGL